ncbi:MAG: hypothetical protein LBQ35_07140 [Spirochaetaceae bacterium]|nr:hypothetical protein [Spirochaetaceae bacterium]
MKKLVVTGIVLFYTLSAVWAGDGKFGEINLRFAYQIEGLFRDNVAEWFNYDINNFYHTDPGFSFGAEYLYSFFDKTLKIGVGAQYELPREAWDSWSGEAADLENERVEYSLLPVYATVQYSPIREFQELFIKGNIGYTILTSIELLPEGIPRPGLAEKKGGLYWQVSAGFEADWGLMFECFYNQKYLSARWDFSDLGMPATSKDIYKARDFGFSASWKFRL